MVGVELGTLNTILAPLSPKIRMSELTIQIKLKPNFGGEGLGVRGYFAYKFGY